jgi:AAA+ ATPase superfamily predicted ATPase
MAQIIGRKKELAILRGLTESNKSEFVAIYGRRRVGKTFLIRTAFEAKKAKGLTRSEIMKESGQTNGGRLTVLLEELEQSGFIRKYAPFGKKTRSSLYQLVDFYVLFYLRFIKDSPIFDENNWLNALDNPKNRAWSGYSFEQICLCHTTSIKNFYILNNNKYLDNPTQSLVAQPLQKR